MAIDPTYQTKSAAVTSASADTRIKAAVVGVRAANASYPVDQTHCTIGGTRYEIDHVDPDGKVRSPDNVAAILQTLITQGKGRG